MEISGQFEDALWLCTASWGLGSSVENALHSFLGNLKTLCTSTPAALGSSEQAVHVMHGFRSSIFFTLHNYHDEA